MTASGAVIAVIVDENDLTWSLDVGYTAEFPWRQVRTVVQSRSTLRWTLSNFSRARFQIL